VISALHQTGKSLAYITVGQKITSGIEVAKSERVLEFLEGFDAV
jgi:flagellar biosynthesis GTPase FlhF